MSSASTLPPEILLLVFESAANYIPGFIDPGALIRAYERNATLTACALVCRSWAAPAQITLFHDIALGITADIVDEKLVVYNERCLPGRTTPALASLVSTLVKFRDNGSTIPRSIRAIHLCIGETDGDNVPNPDFHLDHIIHGSPADVFHAIALCPGLVHLSITLGYYHESDERSAAPMFSAEDIAMLKAGVTHLPNFRQLSIQTHNDTDFVMACGYCFTPDESANTLIAALSDRLTLLDVSMAMGGGYPPEDDEPEAEPIRAFPMLHTFLNEGDTSNIRTAVLHHAPCLRRVELPSRWYRNVPQAKLAAPTFVKELKLGSLREEDDLAPFSQLEVLELHDFYPIYDPLVLRTLPRTIRKLILPATAFEADSMAQKVADALRGLPNLEIIIAVEVSYAPAVVKQVCHLPVHIVPYAHRWQRLIPCTQ